MAEEQDDRNVYRNAIVGTTENPLITDPDELDEAFAAAANRTLEAATFAHTHQAAAILVEGDRASIRKHFSLSEKYAAWANYCPPAKGFGTHAWFLGHNRPVRLIQRELEAHPAWQGFGPEAGQHPPMRGWLAAPLWDRQGKNWGLLQLSDKLAGDFTKADERRLAQLAGLVSGTLETLWKVAQPPQIRREPVAFG